MANLFIVLDGLDGSGKGIMIKKLEEYLKNKGKNVVITKEPTEGRYGKAIKEILRKDDDPKVIKVRLKQYRDRTSPLIELFKKQGLSVIKIDGSPSPSVVFESILKAL